MPKNSLILLLMAALAMAVILTIESCNNTPNEDVTNEDVVAWPQFASKQEQQKLEFQALQGSLDAADRISSVYALNIGEEALFWELIAAENGSASGAISVSSFLSVPHPTRKDPQNVFWRERSWFWKKRAADLGDVEAKSRMDKMVLVPENEVKHWVMSEITVSKFKRAAMLGSQEAAFRLYKYYKNKPQKQDTALFWARIAAQNGQPEAPCIVGKYMLNKKDTRDKVRAKFWLQKCEKTQNNL